MRKKNRKRELKNMDLLRYRKKLEEKCKTYIGKVRARCLCCGKEFEVLASIIRRGQGKYCSYSCAHKARTKKVKRKCEVCGKVFEAPLGLVVRGYAKYCSRSCRNKGRKVSYPIKVCPICGKEFTPAINVQKYCSIKCANKASYEKIKKDKFYYKAVCLGASYTSRKDFLQQIKKMLIEAVNKPCVYCGEIITLENASLDHKEALSRSKLSREEILQKTNLTNLQIICKKCNQLKGNLNDKEYRLLLNFLNKYPSIKEKIFQRFKLGIALFTKHPRKQRN